jgi:NhaA family Na+:H+ antiporter
MPKDGYKPSIAERLFINPINRFISKSTTGGIVLFLSAVVALILANSPWHHEYHAFWDTEIGLEVDGLFAFKKSLHHWINDGLMAIFFFVVGLELKREIIGGELSNIKKATLPIVAALGGMILPAVVYLTLNPSGIAHNGWGIPMATDIAFALGILFLLGDRVPTTLKIFLTALAIADDLGAVLVIAIFYTSDISLTSLIIGLIFLAILLVANRIGIRNTLFYGILGIGGLWVAFLLSGVHATIAGVLAAFTIPANVHINEKSFLRKLRNLANKFEKADPNDVPTLTSDQLHILEDIRILSKRAMTPLQRLEHAMHPFVTFIVMPVFALSNAGVTITNGIGETLATPIALGVFLGLLLGKFTGILGFSWVMIRFKLAEMPEGMGYRHLIGLAILAGIGFTMSLFIANLAFPSKEMIYEAKIGILFASVIAGIIGFTILFRKK